MNSDIIMFALCSMGVTLLLILLVSLFLTGVYFLARAIVRWIIRKK